MTWILDVLLTLIFLLIVTVTVDKGFVKSIWSTVTLIGAFISAYIFGSMLGEIIYSFFVLPKITEYAFSVIENVISQNADGYDISALFDTMPKEFTQLIADCGANLDELSSHFDLSVTISKNELYELAESIAVPISQTVSNAIGIIVVFSASLLAIWLIGFVVKAMVKLPLINTLNGFMGFLLGVTEGFVVLWILCVALSMFAEREFMNPGSMNVIRRITSSSYILKFFCTLSPVNFIHIT